VRKLIFIPLLFICLSLSAVTYYTSTTGTDGAYPTRGTLANPFLTIQYGINQLRVGDTLYIRGGTYSITTMLSVSGTYDGTALNPICVFGYPTETVIIDGNGLYRQSGVWVQNAAYWIFKDLIIKNVWQDGAGDDVKGWLISNSNYVYMINCTAYHIGGPGFATSDNGTGAGGRYYFTNCDSYSNNDSDSDNPGNDADGWTIIGQMLTVYHPTAADTLTWPRVYLTNCRAWNNTDDGYDQTFGAYIEFDSCWAINNGSSGDGNGIKGGLHIPGLAPVRMIIIRNCVSLYNKQGFRINSSQSIRFPDISFYNNTAAYNTYNFNGGYHAPQTGGAAVFKNNIGYGQAIEMAWLTPSNFSMEPGMVYTSNHNTWDVGHPTVTNADFQSIDTTGVTAARQADGSFPNNACYNTFLHLAGTSDLIDAGTNVGLPYENYAPDLGAFEYDTIVPPDTALIHTKTPIVWSTKAQTGGDMINDGGQEITAKGVVWDYFANPDMTNNVINCGTGSADFTTYITGLLPRTTYHVRAYATNASGTSYGADEEFTTTKFSYVFSNGKQVYDGTKKVGIE
jgi:hypothetical protein